MKTPSLSYMGGVAALVMAIWFQLISEVSSLQCFSCSGDTSSDTNDCFEPQEGTTFVQLCGRRESCEKKVIQIHARFKVIERGCSSNCYDRDHIWTDDFHAHCCASNLCNSAPYNTLPTYVTLLPLTLLAVLTSSYLSNRT